MHLFRIESGDCGAGCGSDRSCLCLSCLALCPAHLPEAVGEVFLCEVLQASSLQNSGVNMNVSSLREEEGGEPACVRGKRVLRGLIR